MDLNSSNRIKEKRFKVNVGDTVTIDQVDWTVAEIINGKLILCREEIDGTIQTMEVAENKLESLILQ
ncbi:MAG: hypothetical protein GXO92_06720 [FCB group bacterium]|nr:hypothetical protein [FCB group bacterium]